MIRAYFIILGLALVAISIYGIVWLQSEMPRNPPILMAYQTKGEIWRIYLSVEKSEYMNYYKGLTEELLFDGKRFILFEGDEDPIDGAYTVSKYSEEGDQVTILVKINPPGLVSNWVHKIEFTTEDGEKITLYLEPDKEVGL